MQGVKRLQIVASSSSKAANKLLSLGELCILLVGEGDSESIRRLLTMQVGYFFLEDINSMIK